MTSRLPPQCLSCAYWRSPLDRVGGVEEPTQICTAFPDGIPGAIWWNQADHRQSFKGDHGVGWESLDGAEFPEWALQESRA